MPTNTANLNLFKYGSTDGARTFNIDEALNANWDKIDEAVAKKYTKASTGIPELDLDSAVKAALGKARTALQSVTKVDIGLGNVDNTSDASKPISTAQAAKFSEIEGALTAHKADLVSHGIYGVATGTNALVMTDSKVTSYVDGMLVAFKNTTASTASTTLNINSLGAKAIVKANGTAVNNLKANAIYQLRYNSVNFILLGEGGEYGTATASDVLVGKTFGTENGLVSGVLTLASLNGRKFSSGTISMPTLNNTLTVNNLGFTPKFAFAVVKNTPNDDRGMPRSFSMIYDIFGVRSIVRVDNSSYVKGADDIFNLGNGTFTLNVNNNQGDWNWFAIE